MILYKKQEEIELIREGGKLLAEILDEVISMAKPGVTTAELDAHAEKRMREAGGEPAFKGYSIGPGIPPFASTLCTSINDEIVHAPAVPGRTLKEGDILGLDVGFKYKGYYTDMAKTIPIGDISDEAAELLNVTKKALYIGLEQVKEGNTIGDIGAAIEDYVQSRGDYGIVRDMVGHGVGIKIHEDPQIPNYRIPGLDIPLKRGMVVAIEPMITLGEEDIRILDDQWTVSTIDGSLSAQFEHTIAIDHNGDSRIMTER